MQKHGYSFGNLSLIRSLSLDIPDGVTTVRDHPKGVTLKKEIFGCLFKTPLFLGKRCEVVIYFLYKK